MSTTLPERALRDAAQPLFFRVLSTSVWELLHGRVRPYRPARLDASDIAAASGLPAALAAVVADVPRRARLWRGGREDVARELVAHFEDGLATGASTDELVASFGDPRCVAKLIRRAWCCQRPLAWKVIKAMERTFGGLVLVGLLVYAVQAVRMYSQWPILARNFLAE